MDTVEPPFALPEESPEESKGEKVWARVQAGCRLPVPTLIPS